jgi:Ca2+-transporting ATPase
MIWSLFQGLTSLSVVAAIYAIALARDLPADRIRATTFSSLVVVVIALIVVGRSFGPCWRILGKHPNRAFLVVLAGVAVMLAAALGWPPVRELFRSAPLGPGDLLTAAGGGLVVLLVLEAVKPFVRRATARDRSRMIATNLANSTGSESAG